MSDKNAQPAEEAFAEYVPPLNGRPERESVIGSDDIVNLQIALNTCESLDEFMASV